MRLVSDMAGETRCVVSYGSDSLCLFSQISEPLKQIVLKILHFSHERLDICDFLTPSEDACAEIEKIGQTLTTLARKLREKCSCHLRNVGDDDTQANVLSEKPECTRQGTSVSTHERGMLDQLNANLTIAKQSNDKLQSEVDELRFIQAERFTRLEGKVKQAESRINEKLKPKKLDRRKEQMPIVLKSDRVHNKHREKREQEQRKSSTSHVLALPRCHSKAADQGYEHVRLGSPVPPRSLEEKKGELQLKEEIKWSRLTPVPVHGARRRYQHNVPLPQKKTSR